MAINMRKTCNILIYFILTLLMMISLVFLGIALHFTVNSKNVVKKMPVDFTEAKNKIQHMYTTMNKYPALKISNQPDLLIPDPLLGVNMDGLVKTLGMSLLVYGSLVSLTNVLTIVAVTKKSKGFAYFCLVVHVFWVLAEITFSTCVLRYHKPVNDLVKPIFLDQLDRFENITSHDSISISWNLFMQQYNCCGVDSYLDFNSSTSYTEQWSDPSHSYSITRWLKAAVACCDQIYINNTARPKIPGPCTDDKFIDKKGCIQVFWEAVESKKALVIGCTGLITGLQLLLVIFITITICTKLFNNEITPKATDKQWGEKDKTRSLQSPEAYQPMEQWYSGTRQKPLTRPRQFVEF